MQRPTVSMNWSWSRSWASRQFFTAERTYQVIRLAGFQAIRRVFYGVADPHLGGLGSIFKVHCQSGLNHHFEVFKNASLEKCKDLLKHQIEETAL